MVLAGLETSAMDHRTPWIASRRPKPDARLRLFCFPYAGGASTAYQTWQAALPGTVDVCCIELPGRLARSREAPLRSIQDIVRTMAVELAPLLDRPCALFGYSMGTLIAFEWARHLESLGKGATALFVAARNPPHHPPASQPDHEQPSTLQFLSSVSKRYGPLPAVILEDPELREIVALSLRADLESAAKYRVSSGDRIKAPIVAFGGTLDSSTQVEALGEWKTLTSSDTFVLKMVRGSHFFIRENGPELLRGIAEQLQPFLAG